MRIATVLAGVGAIGIAATVLRPVVIRARANSLRETCLTRAANLGDALLAYTEINDGCLPLAFAFDAKKKEFRWQQVIPYPASWPFTSIGQRIAEDMCTWANATLALSRADKNFFCPSTEIEHMDGVEYRLKRPLPAAMTYTFNGFLHSLPTASIESRETVVLAWEGLGNKTLNGFAIANPTLSCHFRHACRLTPGARLQQMLTPLAPLNAHGNDVIMVMADGHAEPAPIGKVFTKIDSHGKPQSWNNELFLPRKEFKASISKSLVAVRPPDTEKRLPKRP